MIASPAASLRPSVLELDFDATDLLAFLPTLAEAHLVLRAGSFALFRKTAFGAFRPERSGFWRDERSGLALDPSAIRRVCYLSEATPPPVLEIAFATGGFTLSILPGKSARDLAALRAFVADSVRREVPYDAVRREGAAAWLDEGLARPCDEANATWSNRLVFDRLGGAVAAALRSGFLEMPVRFLPRFVDRDGPILRISDAAGETVLHFCADAAPEALPAQISEFDPTKLVSHR